MLDSSKIPLKNSFGMPCSVLIFFFAIACSVAVRGDSLPNLIEAVSPSIVGIGAAFPKRVPTGGRPASRLLGTGFIVNQGGKSYVATNAHVIPSDLREDGSEKLAIFLPNGVSERIRFAEVVARDLLHDLVLLKYTGPTLPSLELATEIVRPGERLAFTGFPIGAVLGLYPATHEGIVSAVTPIARPADRDQDLSPEQVRRLRKPFDVYQLDAIAYPGNSGSAVYRQSDGAVVGVMNSVYVKESREDMLSTPSGIAYVIPVAYLQSLLDGLQQ